jgi:tetratricopeptide (TPR) repeat protein
VHLLIDLSGYSAKNRLPVFAYKPAPVQASWLGYFASTGMPEMDYFIGDAYTLPEDERDHFVEQSWRLAESFCCFTPPNETLDVDIPVLDLPALSNGFITFGSFNKLSKMTDDVVALWARVLQDVPNSQLFLCAKELADQLIKDETYQRFAERGVEVTRLFLFDWQRPRDEHLALYNRVDIALDSFPYVGGTTSVESLWMGVPVLTKKGNRFLSHIGESINHNAGLPEWIAENDDDYVAKAVYFANNIAYLAKLRARLRQQVLASSLFDAPRFAKSFADALWGMWLDKTISVVSIEGQQQEIINAFNAKNYELAFSLGQALTQTMPQHSFGFKVMGTILLQVGQAETAIPYLQHVLLLDPNDIEGATHLGLAFFNLGRMHEAIESYQRAIAINSSYVTAWRNLALAYEANGQLEEAVHCITQLQQLTEGDA